MLAAAIVVTVYKKEIAMLLKNGMQAAASQQNLKFICRMSNVRFRGFVSCSRERSKVPLLQFSLNKTWQQQPAADPRLT